MTDRSQWAAVIVANKHLTFSKLSPYARFANDPRTGLTIEPPDASNYPAIHEWLNHNTKEAWRFERDNINDFKVCFRSQHDATIFKLFFG